MKKVMNNIIFIGLISMILFPFCVSAKSISTLETTASNDKITISGTTEAGVLAVAALVYSNSDLVYMETCEASEDAYSCTLNHNFANGDYSVKVADYDGGEYVTDSISITKKADSNPKTGDAINNSILIGIIALIGLLATTLYSNKSIIKKTNI